jgi:hypothetical protein
MSRHPRSGTVAVPTTVDIKWECVVSMSGRVRWFPTDDSAPLWKPKYKPDFSASELPAPWHGMRVFSRHNIKRDIQEDVWAGRMQSWAYWDRRRWIAIALPDAASAAAPSAAETAAAAAYMPSG